MKRHRKFSLLPLVLHWCFWDGETKICLCSFWIKYLFGGNGYDYALKSEVSKKMGLFVCLLTWSLMLAQLDGHSLFTCEPINIPRCFGMTYNMTFFPNLMGHYDQDTAAVRMEVSSLDSLLCFVLCDIFYNNLFNHLSYFIWKKIIINIPQCYSCKIFGPSPYYRTLVGRTVLARISETELATFDPWHLSG